METTFVRKPTTPRKKEFIDFSKLSLFELKELSQKWEMAARVFEARLESYSSNPKANEEKVQRLWKVGNSLWRRLHILEKWRIKNDKRG